MLFFHPKKSYGQNALADASYVRKIVEAAQILRGETIIEVGPGTGILTQALADAGANVVAVEADADLIPALREKFGDRVEIVEGDILKMDVESVFSVLTSPRPSLAGGETKKKTHVPLPRGTTGGVPAAYRLIANIPYNITSELIQKFLTAPEPPAELVLMVQREVADRITAKPGDMGLLSVACQLYAECKRLFAVPAGAFRPTPKVDSAVVSLRLRKHPALGEQNPEKIIKLAKAGFSSPRKQLQGNLSHAGFGTRESVQDALISVGLNPLIRAEELSVEQWAVLAMSLRGTSEASDEAILP